MMRCRYACLLLGAALVSFCVTSPAAPVDPRWGDMEQLTGVWKCLRVSEDGLEAEKEYSQTLSLTIIGEDYYLLINGVTVPAKIRVNTEVDPAEIDITLLEGRRGISVQGIYRLKGNRLTVAYSAIGSSRPKTFDAAEDIRLYDWERETSTSKTGLRKTVHSADGTLFVLIPPGTFVMGPAAREPSRSDERQRRVTISRPFYMSAHEITVESFRRYAEERRRENPDWGTEAEKGSPRVQDGKPGGYTITPLGELGWVDGASWRNPGWIQNRSHPVIYLSWNDAVEFAQWLSKKEGRRYRLPTEAEWEYACRGGTTTAYWWGNSTGVEGVANLADRTFRSVFPALAFDWSFNDGYVFTAPVGSFKPNPFGFYDMHGNAWEWVADYWAPAAGGAFVDPGGSSEGIERIAKGGGWADRQDRCRAAFRFHDLPESRFSALGVRLVMDID